MSKEKNKTVKAEPGENSKLLRHLTSVAGLGGRVDMNNPDEVKRRIAAYFALCEEDDVKPTLSALAASLGYTRNGFFKIRTGERGTNAETREVLIQAQNVLTALMESYLQEGTINPVSGIFLARNNYGFKNEDVALPDEKVKSISSGNLDDLSRKYLTSAKEEDQSPAS